MMTLEGKDPEGWIERNHKKFIPRVQNSNIPLTRIRLWLLKQFEGRDYKIRIPRSKIAKHREGSWKFRDECDIKVEDKNGRSVINVEVKHRKRMRFTGPEFFKNGFEICSVKSFNYKKVRIYCYIWVNAPMTHAAIVNVAETRKYWYKTKHVDWEYEGKDREEIWYSLPTEHVKFIEL